MALMMQGTQLLPAIQPLGYHQQRMLYARRLLERWLRRWLLFIVTALLLLTAGASSALQIAAALLGGPMVPLLLAAQQPWLLPPVMALYVLLAALPVISTRMLWWPQHWAEAERALPLCPAEMRASDRLVLRGLFLPMQALLWSGLGVLLYERAQSEPTALLLATLTLTTASLCAWLCCDRWMRSLREAQRVLHRPTRRSTTVTQSRGTPAKPPHVATLSGVTPVRWALALLWWPLWRGLATRTARALVLSSIVTPALAAAPMAAPAYTGWWLAALALAGLAGTSWLRSRSEQELQTRWPRWHHLPITVATWQAARRTLVLAPMLLALAVAALGSGPVLLGLHANPWVLFAFWTVLLFGAWLEALPAPADAVHHASRALFVLALATALGSEVLP